MTQTNYLQIDVGTTKQARAYQRKKEKKNTEEHKQFQQEAAIYLRVSSEMQKEGFSIEAQKLACQRCVQEKGFHLSEDHIYIDEAFTAKNEDRPAFRKMMVDAYMKQFSLIVVHKMDRFERNAEASAKTSRELKAIGVKVFSAYENLELSDDLFCKILSALNEHYIANLSMETAKGKHQSARSGYSNCSRPPFGYRKWQHGDPPEMDRRILIVDHPAAEAVREIFELYATGMYSFMDLAQYLNDKGFRTCTGRAFGKETIRSMMENVVYVGCVVYNNSLEEKFEIYPGKHEAIIPIDLFKKVKEIRSQKIIAHNTAPVGDENIKKHCLVQNLVCCADCGQRLRVKRSSYSDNAYRYIDCATIRGLTSEKGQTHVKIDKSAPKAVCDVKSSPTFGEWYTGNVKIEGKSTDSVSGVYENLFSSGGTTSKNSITLSQTGRNISVSLTAKDYAYNTDQVSCGSFSIDNTAPVLDSFTVPDASPYGTGNLTFSVSGYDNESGVKSVVIIVDGEEHSTSGSQGTVSVSFTKTGEHTVSYRITDNVGLTAESSVFTFLIDIDPPDLIINEISHNGITGLLVPGDTVSGFGTDPGSGFSKVYISFPGNNSFKSIDYSVINPAPPAESIVWSTTADFSVQSGKYSVSVKGTDKVGNESVVVSVPVTVDAEAPVTDYTVSGNQSDSGWYRGSVTITAASTDQGTGVMSESVSLSCSPAVSIAEGKTVTIPASYSGTCSVTVKASDYADNKSENTVNKAVKIDNTAPESSSFSPAAGSVNGNQVHACVIGAKDQHSGLKSGYLRITGPVGERKLTSSAQGGNQVCFDASFSTDGSYSLYYELEDKAGNKNGESAPVVITIDATGPEIHFTSVPASFKNRDKSVAYTGSGSDSVTGIGSARYSIDGGESWEDLELAEDGSFTITAAPYERMTVRVSMTDKAGNESLIESAPLIKVSDASAKLSVPAATESNMLIRPVVVDMEGNAVDDYSGIESARAFVYGQGYDHRDIELSARNNYAFRWDGTFPKDEIRETEDGETVIIEGSVEAPEGWYWLTIEVTDVDGNISCYNTRIHAGESTPQDEPVKAPEYTTFDISGKVNVMDSVSVTVSGTRYMLADFSRIEAGIGENTKVIGKGRGYTKENVLVIETLQAVKETLTPFSGLVDDLGADYVIIDGHALAIDSETQRYCEDIRTGDYVSGLYRTENGTMIAAEFGPISCDRNEITRTDTGIVENK